MLKMMLLMMLAVVMALTFGCAGQQVSGEAVQAAATIKTGAIGAAAVTDRACTTGMMKAEDCKTAKGAYELMQITVQTGLVGLLGNTTDPALQEAIQRAIAVPFPLLEFKPPPVTQ